MSLMLRFTNLFRSKANKMISDLEDPIELLELSIKDRVSNLDKVKLSSAEVFASVRRTDDDIRVLEDELAILNKRVLKAVEDAKMDTAKNYMASKLDKERQLTEMNKVKIDLGEKSESLKNVIETEQREISKLDGDKKVLKAKYDAAKLTKDVIKSTTVGKSSDVSYEKIEEKINDLEYEAKGLADLKALADREDDDSEVDIDAELQNFLKESGVNESK